MLIPGVGQIWQDRHLSGLIYFFLCAFFINGIFVGPYVLSKIDDETVGAACGGLAVLVWLISAYDYLRTEGARRKARAERPPSVPDPEGNGPSHG